MSASRKHSSFDEVILKAIKYCAYQERCVWEVEERCKKWKVSEGDRSRVVKFLMEEGYLNQERFVEAFIEGKFRIKSWGRNKIRFALLQKNIPLNDIDVVLYKLTEEDYMNTIYALINRKAASLKVVGMEKREKLYRYMLNKGYESELVVKALSKFN